MRVTVKGQVTVPKELRERFGITPEIEVEFVEDRGKLLLVKKTNASAIKTLRNRIKTLPGDVDVDTYIQNIRGE